MRDFSLSALFILADDSGDHFDDLFLLAAGQTGDHLISQEVPKRKRYSYTSCTASAVSAEPTKRIMRRSQKDAGHWILMYRKRRIFGRTVAGLVSSILSLALARLWDVQTGDLLATLPHEKLCEYCDAGTGVDVAFSPNGLTIATSTFSRVYLWDAPTKKLKVSLIDERLSRVLRNGDKYVRQTFSHGQTIYEIAFSPDGRTLASRSRDGTTKLWDATTGQLDAILRIGWSVK